VHNEEVHNLHVSINAIRVIKYRRLRWGGRGEQVGRMEKMRNVYNILDGNPDVKGPLGRRKRRWEDNIRIDLNEKGWEGVDSMHLTQDTDQGRALVNIVINLWVP
jgi:hypothetical protein